MTSNVFLLSVLVFLGPLAATKALECHNCWWFENTPPAGYISLGDCEKAEGRTPSPVTEDRTCIVVSGANVTWFDLDDRVRYQGRMIWRSSWPKADLGNRAECMNRLPEQIVRDKFQNIWWSNPRFCQCDNDGCNSAPVAKISAVSLMAMVVLSKLLL